MDDSAESSSYGNMGGNDEMKIAEDVQQEPSIKKDDTEDYFPIGPKLIGIVGSLMLGVFCMALDNTIIVVAVPRISDEFHNLNNIGWYGSAYLLTSCAFQLFFGKLYTLFDVKWTFLTALFIFEVGSLICGMAPTSTVFIAGRAVAGFGSAGLYSGAMVAIAHVVKMEQRPMFFGLIGGVYGVASVAGPLVGGAFTDHITWRWCFYINLPLGGIAAAGLLFLFRLKKKVKTVKESASVMFWRLDPAGNIIFVPLMICLLLALQWGGVDYAWSDVRIIALFVVFAVVLIGFCVLQVCLKENATLPVRIVSQRTIAFTTLFSICNGGSFFVYIYFIPIWFQAVMNTSVVASGIYCLPLVLAEVVAAFASGALVTIFGYFAPFFIASSVLMSVGAALITLFTVNIPQAKWAGYQFLYGFGVGLGFQQGNVAAQAVLDSADVSVGTAMVIFVQILGGSIFVSVAQTIFTNSLVKNLLALNLPGVNPRTIVQAGATSLRDVVDPAYLPEVLVAYNAAIVKSFQPGMILSCLSILGALGIEWRNIKRKKVNTGGA